ncbi:MAG TPA: serine hydrolase domain-containing protein [Polyangia bacterium]|jgi:CubicO group peptidase (beta-lactamase class C family)
MFRRLALACALLCAACADTPPPAPVTAVLAPSIAPALQVLTPPAAVAGFADPERRAKLAATFPALEKYFAEQQSLNQLPSLAVGVIIDGGLAYEKGFGVRDLDGKHPADADTVYRIGSITKTFTGLAMLRLRDQGKLALDDPAARYLPALGAVKYPTADSAPITLRHLLTHTSGLPRVGAFTYAQSDHDVTEPEMLGVLPNTTLVFPPGAGALYSNFGFGLLGAVITRVSGLRYRDYVNQTILAPLDMNASRWAAGDVATDHLAVAYRRGPNGPLAIGYWRLGASEAAGGLYSSVRDLARYVAFQLAAYPARSGDDTGLVRRSSVREAHTPQRLTGLRVDLASPADERDGPIAAYATGIGLGWHFFQTCAYEQVVRHNGGTEGFSSAIAFLPQRGVGLVLLTNLADVDTDPIVEGALDILRGSGALATRVRPASQALQHAADQAANLYANFRQADYAQAFTPSFRAAVSAAQAMEIAARFKAQHGACGRPTLTPIPTDAPNQATFSAACEHGRLEYTLAVGPDGLITEALLESHELPPSPRLSEIAGRIAGLTAEWNESTFTTLLAPTFSRAAMQSLFKTAGAAHGACHVDRPLEGDGQRKATLALTCARGGDLKLALEISADGARVTGFRLSSPHDRKPDERCPTR